MHAFLPHSLDPLLLLPLSCASNLDLYSGQEVSDLVQGLPLEVRKNIIFVRYNQIPELGDAEDEELVRLAEERPFGGHAGGKSNPASYAPEDSMFIIEVFDQRRLLRPTDPAVAEGQWRVAIVDLDGHFAIATVVQGELVLANTTQANYLKGGGLLAAAMAHDVLLKAGVCEAIAAKPAGVGLGVCGGGGAGGGGGAAHP